MPSDTTTPHSSIFQRLLFDDTGLNMLFEPLGLGALVPIEMLLSGLTSGPASGRMSGLPSGPVSEPPSGPVTETPSEPASAPASAAPTPLPQPADAAANTAISAAVAAGLSGADQAMLGNLARAASGVSGAGVVVGVLSDSFNVLGGYATDVSQGLLAPGVTVLKEGSAGSSDEGRAMAQLIHQVAPDAQIIFYSAFGGAADFANGIKALANAGASVIVDDVTYLNEPFYQDGGVIQTAVEQVVAAGVS